MVVEKLLETPRPPKPTPPMIIVRWTDFGPSRWEKIFCYFGWHQFHENIEYEMFDNSTWSKWISCAIKL